MIDIDIEEARKMARTWITQINSAVSAAHYTADSTDVVYSIYYKNLFSYCLSDDGLTWDEKVAAMNYSVSSLTAAVSKETAMKLLFGREDNYVKKLNEIVTDRLSDYSQLRDMAYAIVKKWKASEEEVLAETQSSPSAKRRL